MTMRCVRRMVIMTVVVMVFSKPDRRRDFSNGPLELMPCTGGRRGFGHSL